MNTNELQSKVINATKWSTISEIASKLVNPITNMILARILAPEAFGVVATITMIVSFADMFTDSGFQKYLIQHDFKNEEEKFKNSNVAFWINLAISIALWIIIYLMRNYIANLVGNPGLGNIIAIACLQLPLTSFSSIQMALYRRDFDFKALFVVRLVSICIPFFITVPLAFLGLSYWALIIGTLTIQLTNTIILTIKSKWKPKLFFSRIILKEMLSFSIWSLIEAISIWLTAWIDTFIIGSVLNQYYLGLYKVSTSMVNSLMSLITASIIPVLFSALARLQDDRVKFIDTYFKFQKLVSIIIIPLGLGIYLYRNLATEIFLGSNWSEASNIIGVWALTSSITIVFGYFCSEIYRAKGRPKLSFLAQTLHLIFLIPACIISSKYGFWSLIYTRSWIRIQSVIVHFIIMKFAIGVTVLKTIKNVLPMFISATVMTFVGFALKQINNSMIWSFFSIIICVVFYFGTLFLFPNIRKEIFSFIRR